MEKIESNIMHINETYESDLNILTISKDKLNQYFNKFHSISIVSTSIKYRNLTQGSVIDTQYMLPKLGDEAEIRLNFNIIIPNSEIISLKENLRKIPRVENINIINNNIVFNFDNRILVKLK